MHYILFFTLMPLYYILMSMFVSAHKIMSLIIYLKREFFKFTNVFHNKSKRSFDVCVFLMIFMPNRYSFVASYIMLKLIL